MPIGLPEQCRFYDLYNAGVPQAEDINAGRQGLARSRLGAPVHLIRAGMIKALFLHKISRNIVNLQEALPFFGDVKTDFGRLVKGVRVILVQTKRRWTSLIADFSFYAGQSPHNCAEEKIAVFSQIPASTIRVVGASCNRLDRIGAYGEFRLKIIFDRQIEIFRRRYI